MDMPTPLIVRLRTVADIWVAAHEPGKASLARLGRDVVNDGGFFARVADNGSTTTITLEKFARFLDSPHNWPGGHVPHEARLFALVTGVSPERGPESPDSAGDAIGSAVPA